MTGNMMRSGNRGHGRDVISQGSKRSLISLGEKIFEGFVT